VAKRVCLVGVCLVGVLLALSGQASAAGGHWAVICGIANYQSVNDLTYTDDDARDMAAALKKYPEWNQRSDQIVVLIDSAASKQGVLGAIQQMGSKAAAGDTCVFFFSGHGTQVPDTSGDESDGLAEAICPWDTYFSGSTIKNVITDDELGACLTASLATQQVVVILDTCFSGGMAKGVEEGTVKCVRNPRLPAKGKVKRAFGFHVAQRLARRENKAPGGTSGGPSSKDIGGTNSVVLMACEEGSYSYETRTLRNGVFTYYVVEGLGSPSSGAPADSDGNHLVSAEEDFGYAAPRTTSFAWRYLRVTQKPQLYDGNTYADTELVTPPAPPASVKVAVTTDKTTYTNGQRATITVTVTDESNSPIEGATVQVVVTSANGRTTTYQGTTDSGGIVTFLYKVSTKTGGKGTYNVNATATKLGVSGTGSTTFTVN